MANMTPGYSLAAFTTENLFKNIFNITWKDIS